MLTLASLFLFAVPKVPAPPSDGPQELPIVRVETDDTLVDQSCRLVFPEEPIADENGDGVVHVRGERLTIVCEGRLRGSAVGVDPDQYAGMGIVLKGEGHRLKGAAVSGFKVGILVDGADDTVVLNGDVADNFRQRLGSTWEREDPADWLWPHANDEGQWLENYGAGLAVRAAESVTVERLWARDVQNGIVLDRANSAIVLGCDCSFLSGWGCALWRTSRASIYSNRFDFCIRGYSHGRYNRGQDSAGVLMFEQCCSNSIYGNSITHGGDGVFGFAGREALGQVSAPFEGRAVPFTYERRGCNRNTFALNDLSYAAAHGLEMTFSFDNDISKNLVESNGVCGLWLGYSRDSRVVDNRFTGNGSAGYGSERGAINAEHSQHLIIHGNSFKGNALDVRLWSDDDVSLRETPWVMANGQGTLGNSIWENQSDGGLLVELREAGSTSVDFKPSIVDADEASRANLSQRSWRDVRRHELWVLESESKTWPERSDVVRYWKKLGQGELSERVTLPGREHIVIGEWGPYDWTYPYLQPLESRGGLARYRLLGPPGTKLESVTSENGRVMVTVSPAGHEDAASPDGLALGMIEVRPLKPGVPTPFDLVARVADAAGETVEHELRGVLLETAWETRFARWEIDPRKDREALAIALAEAPVTVLRGLDLEFGSGGPADVVPNATPELEALGRDQFGTWATTTLKLPVGGWLLRTVSDDGLLVQIDGQAVIEDWTWHGPTPHEHCFKVTEEREVRLDVRHFELDGWAQLTVELEPADS